MVLQEIQSLLTKVQSFFFRKNLIWKLGKAKLNNKVNKIFLDFTTELKPLSNQTTVSILLIPVECRTLVRYEPCNDPTHNWFLCGSMSGHRSAESERWTCWILIEKAFLSPNFVGPRPKTIFFQSQSKEQLRESKFKHLLTLFDFLKFYRLISKLSVSRSRM